MKDGCPNIAEDKDGFQDEDGCPDDDNDKDGILDKDGKGKLRLTPRAISKMQRKALMEVFANLRTGQREGHEKITPGPGGDRIEGTKAYQYGDPVSELDLHQTLHNALARHGLPGKKDSEVGVQGSSGVGVQG